ncbi:MAG: tRNA dihydrouridine synthase DusB [Pseudomonadales bacterium]|nr:tRNA dihydrouridine synthase DusB [Pseudomonadales bacterium]
MPGPIRIGPYVLRNRVALAPMAGVTDLPFRRLCHRHGAGLVVSEMVASNPALRDTRKSRLRRVHDIEIEPRSVQIAGGDPEMVADAARFNVAEGAQIIDINMGCPAKKVCRKAAGSALLRDEALVRAILEATVAAVDVPVTLKMRTGWSPELRNGVSIARIAEDAGVAALAVHGRTRADRFLGAAEFATIREIVAAVDLPVFANGDIDSPQRAATVLRETGAAGVMIGRAAQGRPWLCGHVAHYLEHGELLPVPDPAAQGAILSEHAAALHDFHGVPRGVRIARKHVGWAVAALRVSEMERRDFLRNFNGLEEPAGQLDAIDAFFGRARLAHAA